MYRNSDTTCRLGLFKTQRIFSKLVKFYRWMEIGVEDLVITLSRNHILNFLKKKKMSSFKIGKR